MKKYYIYFVLVCSSLSAQFNWDDNGLYVRQGYHVEWFRGGDISSDGNMIVVWSDTRESTRNVYAQSVDADGNIKWDILKDVLKLVLASDISDKNFIPDYSSENVSEKVCKIIIGYTGIVNKFIWMK